MREQLKIAVAFATCVALAGCGGPFSGRPRPVGYVTVAATTAPAPSTVPFSQLASLSVEPTAGTRPVANASAADQDAARSVLSRSLEGDSRVDSMSSWNQLAPIPKQWWATHRLRPNKLVFFVWGARGGSIGFGTAAVVQATPDSTWTILYSGGGY